jgi:hypothetical protein
VGKRAVSVGVDFLVGELFATFTMKITHLKAFSAAASIFRAERFASRADAEIRRRTFFRYAKIFFSLTPSLSWR